MKTRRKVCLLGLGSAILITGALPAAANPSDMTAAPAVMGKMPAAIEKTMPAGDGPTASVEAKLSRDDAVALARKLLDIPDDYTLDNVNFNAFNMGSFGKKQPSWYLNFTKREQERYFASIGVTLDADSGKLLQFNRYNQDPSLRQEYPPKANFEQAKKAALDYLQRMNPEEMKQVRYNDMFEAGFKTPLQGEIRYQIRYDRTVNGIPFPQHFISAEVDGNGSIVGYQYQWDDSLKFPDADQAISQEQAEQIMRKEADVSLFYAVPYQQQKIKNILTAYQIALPTLDALTGKPWVPKSAGTQSKTDRTPLADKPQAEKPAADKALTKDQAIEKITSAFTLPENAKLEDASYSEYNDPYNPAQGGMWNIRWTVSTEQSDMKGYVPSNVIWATVNASTGEIRNFNRSNGPRPFEGQGASQGEEASDKGGITLEQAKERAVETVRKLLPHALHQLALYSANEPAVGISPYETPAYHLFFKRLIDGVEANYEGVTIAINRKTGEVMSFDNNTSQIAYPESKPQTISPEKAEELLLSQYRIELQYNVQYNRGPDFYPAGIPIEKYNVMVAAGEIVPSPGDIELKLVYVPVSKLGPLQYDTMLDAVSGEWRNRSTGEITKHGKIEVTDVKGHPAEQPLRLMAEYGALDVQDGKINPDQAMTRGEMIKMLMIALNGGYFSASYGGTRAASFSDVSKDSAYFAYVESAVDRRLIDPSSMKQFRPEEKMNRADLAELYVRALGYLQLSKTPDMFKLTASDAGQIKSAGVAAIVINLGIMPTIDGAFKSDAAVTRAEAAQSFYRYLQKRSELQDLWPRY